MTTEAARSNKTTDELGFGGTGARTPQRLSLDTDVERLTHYLFRYPAKFHPPVVRALLERYTREGDTVFDPFCGSGTLMVEARVMGRTSVGTDIDPLAVVVATVKTKRYQIKSLRASADAINSMLSGLSRSTSEYERLMFADLSQRTYLREVGRVIECVPKIPNLFHWFRRYVIVDLANIRSIIEQAPIPTSHRLLFQVVFASIIRNASNADPVPVSGLEVTSHMKRRDQEGRLVNPYRLFERALSSALDACQSFAQRSLAAVKASAYASDATHLGSRIARHADAVITSPPYHGAVDYYRRHQLEMFWLGLTNTQEERLRLLKSYIGRPKVPASHPFVQSSGRRYPLATSWENRIRLVSKERANAFRHYVVAIASFFEGLHSRLRGGSPVLLVVGHSTWNGFQIPTTDLFEELAGSHFRLDEVMWYPVKNRYMSYSRHNNANIDREYVVVLRRSERRPVKDHI